MKKESREHLDKAEEFLKATEALKAQGLHSIAVGRAYYAMFHAATAALLSIGIERSSHHALISAFGQYLVKPGFMPQHFQTYLHDAFDIRGDGDYRTGPAVDEKQLNIQLSRAREFVDRCHRFCS